MKPGPCLTLVSGDLYTQQGGGAIQEERVDTETGEVYQTAAHIDRGKWFVKLQLIFEPLV